MTSRRHQFLRCLAAACAVLAFVGSSLCAWAQEPAAPAGGIEAIPAAGDPGAMIPLIKLNDNPVATVLDLLEQLTGRSVLRPQQLPTPTITFNSHGPISKADAIIALESLLSLNNIAVTPLGEKFIKVVVITNIKTESPELVVGSLREQPPSGRIVSKLFRLEHLDTATFQTQIQPFLSPGFGAAVPFQNSNTILVTDTVSNLQRLEYVLDQVDKPRELTTKFYTLHFAQAQAVAEKIKSLIETTRSAFSQQTGKKTAPGGGQLPQNAAPSPAGGDSSTDVSGAGLGVALVSATTNISYDERTNQVILVTDPTSVPFFENLIEKLDVQADPSTQIAVIQIQHADAEDVASLLSEFISGSTSASKKASSSSSSSSKRSYETFPGLSGSSSSSNNRTQNSNNANMPPMMPGSQNRTSERSSQFSEYMTITADDRSNAIVASGTQDDLILVRALVQQLDVVLPQVQVDVLIASVTVGKTIERGIDAFTNITVEGNRVVGVEGVSGSGFSLADIVINHVSGADSVSGTGSLTASNSWSNVRVLSVPSITTTHNQEATVNIAKSVPIITSSYSDTSSTTTARNSYSYQDVGIELTVKPLIGADGSIQMEIEQSANEIESYNSDDQPIIATRTAKSFVTVGDGEIIVLGGLQQESKSKTRTGFPLVSEIPLIGSLFGSNTNDKSRQEIIFFIQPRILGDSAAASRLARSQINSPEMRKMLKERFDRAASSSPEPEKK